MTSRPPSSSLATGTAATSRGHPTPRHTAPRSRSTSTSTRVPPPAPKPSRRPTDSSAAASSSNQTNPVFSLAPPSLVPRASCGKPDDILAPPDAQSCPFAKAGLKVVGIGSGPYGELEGWLEWPAELYADELKQANITNEIKAIYTQDEQSRTTDTTNRLMESLKSKVEKLKEDEWMYSSTDTLFKRDQQVK